MKKKISLVTVAILVLLLLDTATSAAHRLVSGSDSGITQIPDSVVSYAFYETVQPGSEVAAYAVEVQGEQRFHVAINVPMLGWLSSYNSTLGTRRAW